MNLNQFESSGEITLNQILQTLDQVHGIKFNVDFDRPTIIEELSECKHSFEIIRDRIINESAFNSYQTNAEYIKSMLVLEAVKLLTEIAPRRSCKRSTNETIAPIPPIGGTPRPPVGTNPLQPAKTLPGSASGSNDYKNGAIDAIVNNHTKKLITPDIAKQQLRAQGLQDQAIDTMLAGQQPLGQPNSAPVQPPIGNVSEDGNAKLDKIVTLGQNMMSYSNDKTDVTDNNGLRVLNAFSRVGEKLLNMGTSFGPQSLTDNEKKIIRLFQLHLQGADQNFDAVVASNSQSISEAYQIERTKIKEALLMIRKINEFQNTGATGTGPELAKAQVIIAAKAITGKVQDMAEDVAKLSVDELMPLVDMMREQFGPEISNGFNQSFKAALESLLDLTTKTKETLSTAVDTLASGGVPAAMTDIEQLGSDETGNDELGGDEFGVGGDELGGDEMGAEPEAPLGREKKDELAEAKKKGGLPPWLVKGKDGKVTKKGKDGKVEENEDVKESAPPGKKAEDFITSNKIKFKKQYGKKWEEVLYATAWRKFGKKNENFDNAKAVVAESTDKIARINVKMAAHKKSFAKSINEGKSSDPLGLGYGLEGDALKSLIRGHTKRINEAKSIMLQEMQTGIRSIISAIATEKKVAAISEAKQNTPYGIIYKTVSGKKSCKMFESTDIRSHWLSLRGATISNTQMIEPATFDKAIAKTKAR